MENEQEQFEKCLAELKSIENIILPQLNELTQKLDAKYKAYADLAQDLGNMTLAIGNFNSETSNKIYSTTALVSRGIESYGAYKTAKEHNRKLDEMMDLKRSLAGQKRKQITDWLPRISANVEKSKRFCESQFSKTFPLSSVSPALVSLQLKFLNLYRTNLYYESLAKWMLKEYSSWLNGQQTCGMPTPSLYDVNTELGERLYGANLYEYYQRAVESDKSISGKDIFLIADPQLTIMALDAHDGSVEVHSANANPAISKILDENEGVKYYQDNVTEMCQSINRDPASSWNCIALIFAVGFFLLLSLNREILTPKVLGMAFIVGELCIFRVWNKIRKKIYMIFLEEVSVLAAEVDLSTKRICGYIEQEEVDYEKKNALSEAVSQFIMK